MPRAARPNITWEMKQDALLFRYVVTCAICGKDINPGQAVEWDHIQALVHGGPHVFTNLRPLHELCHLEKTRRDVAANAKVKRLRGETCNRPKRDWPSRPMQSGNNWPAKGSRPMRRANP